MLVPQSPLAKPLRHPELGGRTIGNADLPKQPSLARQVPCQTAKVQLLVSENMDVLVDKLTQDARFPGVQVVVSRPHVRDGETTCFVGPVVESVASPLLLPPMSRRLLVVGREDHPGPGGRIAAIEADDACNPGPTDLEAGVIQPCVRPL
jgi:hypothetical protein